MTPELREELVRLLGELVEGSATAANHTRLRDLVADDADAREYYFAFMNVHAQLLWKHGAVPPATVQETAGPPAGHSAKSAAPVAYIPQGGFNLSQPWVRTTLVLVVGISCVGILAYLFAGKSPQQPVATGTTPAAKVVGTSDAQWAGPLGPSGDSINPGQHLMLQRGSAEIVFSNQARVIFEGPSDFVITDAASCRLDGGKLTAHVPAPRGFKVHTPGGTVTDRGTEFGVSVKTSLEIPASNEPKEQTQPTGPQPGSEPPVTEVHVFKGTVDISKAESGKPKAGTGDAVAQNPTSDPSTIHHPPSTILSAGQAVTISDNKVQPLPAADPFKFAIDKLAGKPRTVLLSEDFESYDLGPKATAIGPWIVQSGRRKGQGISVEDPAEMITAGNTTVDPSLRVPTPPTLVGSRAANFATGPQNPKDSYPVMCREIDGKLLAKKCQVLVEFDFFPRSVDPQLSFALATEAGHTPGIELWRSVDAAKQGVDAAKQSVDAAKKIDFVTYRWYRMRVLLSVADGVVSEVRVDRSQWRGPEGWVRDLSYQLPTPKLDWSTPPRYAIFGFPVVSPATVGGVFWLDNFRIEVIAER